MMKTIKYIYKVLAACVVVFAMQSCGEDFEDPISEAPSVDDMPWQANTKLEVNADTDQNAFIWEKNLLTYNEYWKNDEVLFHMTLQSNLKPTELDKIEFYINAEEKDGYNYEPPFDNTGVLIETISSFNEELTFDISLSATEVYDLFQDKFQLDRQTTIARNDDKFEINWVIYAKDGSVLDTRESAAINSRFGFATVFQEFAPPIWEGIFQYEWLEMGSGITQYDPSIVVGTTGTMYIEQVDASNYTVDNIHFGHSSGRAGTIAYDFETGEVESDSALSDTWVISNVNGASLEIAFTNSWSSGYAYWGTVRLTRTDGANWPTNIHTD